MFNCPEKSRLIGRRRPYPILLISRICSFSKIFPSVVCLNSVSVVKYLFGPFPRHIEPCKAMRVICRSIYSDGHVPMRLYSPGHGTFGHVISSPNFPSENPGCRIVIKTLQNGI